MSNKKRKIIILTILVFIWMSMIYFFSSQDSTESSGTSGVIVQTITKAIPNFENKHIDEKVEIVDALQHFVRKTAHFAIYALGGILLVSLTTECSAQNPKFAALLIGTLYATTDEWHQYYIPGRSAEIADVCLDAVGVLTGIIVFIIIVKLIQRRKEGKRCEE